MENFAITALAEQLKPALTDVIVRRIVQHQAHGFIFQTNSPRLSGLKILMNPQFPAFYASEAKPPGEVENSDFLMVLRKHLTSAQLIEFRKPLSERILEFEFKTVVPSRELERMTMVVELIPNSPNIILLDMERRLLASLLPISRQHEFEEFAPYAPPVMREKIALERIIQEENFELPETDGVSPGHSSVGWLVSHVSGLGPVLATEILYRQKASGLSVAGEIRALLAESAASHSAWIYSDLPFGHILEQNDLRLLEKAVVSPMQLQSLERSHSKRSVTTISEAARLYFDELESRSLLERAKLPLLREMRSAEKSMAERERKLVREQKKYSEADSLHKTAQMLTASGLKMDQRYDKATVTNYYGEQPATLQVELDSTITLRENIDGMFKLHHKAGRGRAIVEKKLEELRGRKAIAQEQTRRLSAIRDWDTWLAVEGRIQKEREQPSRAGAAPKSPAGTRFRGILVDGREILVGRNSRENDELTFRTAASDDFWLHAGDYSGSHVVIRNPTREEEPPQNVLTKAAQLAAYFSRARNSTRVEVHYTRRKHVSKPRKAKPGLVRLTDFKSIAVEPRNWLDDEHYA